MTEERYQYLSEIKDEYWLDQSLTRQEKHEGWHYCEEWNGMLRNNNELRFGSEKCMCHLKELYKALKYWPKESPKPWPHQ